MIKLTDILKEVKIANPYNLMIIPTKTGIALLVNKKYLYEYDVDYNELTSKYNDFIYINCYIEIDIDKTETYNVLNISLIEPGFGGGAPEHEINNAYDEFEEEIKISQSILIPYCEDYDETNYSIPLKKIQNIGAINKEYL
jgi:hypothetical protein